MSGMSGMGGKRSRCGFQPLLGASVISLCDVTSSSSAFVPSSLCQPWLWFHFEPR